MITRKENYRQWQAQSMFQTGWFSVVFARTMRFWAKPLYTWAVTCCKQDLRSSIRILDVGAGNGNFMWYATRNMSGKHISLLDQSPTQLAAGEFNINEMARRNTLDKWVASAEALPFSDSTFDLVVSTGSINLWERPAKGLEEMWRVCRKPGSVWVFDQAPCITVADAVDALLVKRMFGLGLPGYTQQEILTIASTTTLPRTPTLSVTDHSFYGLQWKKV